MTEKLVENYDLERPSALGLAALILIAQREQTSVTYQHKEWNFSDIPREIIEELDELGDEEQFVIAKQLIDCSINVSQVFQYFTGLMPMKNLYSTDKAKSLKSIHSKTSANNDNW